MSRWLMALLLVLLCVAVVVLPLLALFSEPSGGFKDLRSDLPLRVRSGASRARGGVSYVPGEVLVKFRGGVSEVETASIRAAQGFEEVYVSPFNSVRRWRVPAAMSVPEWAEVLGRNPLVEYAEPNYVAYASMVPDDPGFGLQWHLDNGVYGGIHAKAAWDMVRGDSRVVVAVVDTGVAYEDYAGQSFWHVDTYKAYSGHSWWCGVYSAPYSWTALYPGTSAAPGYGNGWREYLQHAFDLRVATGTVTFSFRFRCSLEFGYDYAFVEVSSDGGHNWVQLKNYTGVGTLSEHDKVQWRLGSVDLTSFRGSEVLVRFRVWSDEIFSDEDYWYYRNLIPPVTGFDSDSGAFHVDEVTLTHGGGTLFYDDVESGAGSWVTTGYERAPDLGGTSFLAGWDFVNQDAHPNDDNGHGTHVAGTIAQTTNNGLGVAGVAFETTVMPVKVLSAEGSGTYQWIADGIHYAVDNGADIISMSLGGSSPSSTLQAAVAYAYNSGVVVLAASGNGGNDGVGDPACDYPAAYDAYVIAVGATQYNEARAPYSNYGASLDIVAPGGNTDVDLNGDLYADGVLQNTFSDTTVDWAYWFYQGTSMATPHASGVAALILARNSSLNPDQVRSILQNTAEDLGTPGKDNTFGYGLIDAEAALRSMAEPVHLLLAVDQFQATYARGQSLGLTVTVFNEMNPAFDSSLSLTITGPDGCYHYDFQPIAIAADQVKDYSFTWAVPQVAGTYVVEVGLVPAQLTAYDTVWLRVS